MSSGERAYQVGGPELSVAMWLYERFSYSEAGDAPYWPGESDQVQDHWLALARELVSLVTG